MVLEAYPNKIAILGDAAYPCRPHVHPFPEKGGLHTTCTAGGEQADVAVLNRAMLLTKVPTVTQWRAVCLDLEGFLPMEAAWVDS